MPLDEELIVHLRRVLFSAEKILPNPALEVNWSSSAAAIWRQHSFSGYLEPLLINESFHLEDLFGIDQQKNIVEQNTRQFLEGYPANNVLLWGSRGTGKSSLIRGLLTKYFNLGLRVIQIDKNDLKALPDVFNLINKESYKFIVFCDDLSFDQGEKNYKELKSVLDGSVSSLSENALIYVTSNRRYLIPEYETDNLGAKMVNNEVHFGEGVEEKVSLADRFGLWVPFHRFSQDQYLYVVRQCIKKLCRKHQLTHKWGYETEVAAIAWSHDKSKRCGRTAFQFSKDWIGRLLLSSRSDSSRLKKPETIRLVDINNRSFGQKKY